MSAIPTDFINSNKIIEYEELLLRYYTYKSDDINAKANGYDVWMTQFPENAVRKEEHRNGDNRLERIG
jgi:hypothetical protein